jgi:hypothetical protein
MADVKTLTITLAGQTYTVRSDENLHVLEQAALLVDVSLKETIAKAPALMPEKQVLFTAFALAQRLCKLEMEQQESSEAVKRMMAVVESSLGSIL